MSNVVWSAIYLGDLTEMDTNEGTVAVETTAPLLTTFGAGAGNALATNIFDLTSSTPDNSHYIDQQYATDTITYNLGGGGVTAPIDAIVTMNGTVTFYDGTTWNSTFTVIQDTTGATFLLVGDSQAPLASQGIDTITFTSTASTGVAFLTRSNFDSQDFVCLGPGTMIDTPLGRRRADKLAPGDYVTTLDHGPQRIRWIGKRRLTFDDPHQGQPILIPMGAMGGGLPDRDTLLSPHHRVLLATSPAHALHDPLGALAPAKALTAWPRIRTASGRRAITYFSLLLPRHAILIANGIAVESLFPGPQAFAHLSGPQRSDWLRLAAVARVTGTPPARLMLTTAEAREGLRSGHMTPPAQAPRPQPWSARQRRARPLPLHLADRHDLSA